MTCRHPKGRQGNGDRVCTRRTCKDCAQADLITSCCLAAAEGEGADQACSECGTPCAVRLTDEQQDALQTAADVLAGDARGVAPDEPAPGARWPSCCANSAWPHPSRRNDVPLIDGSPIPDAVRAAMEAAAKAAGRAYGEQTQRILRCKRCWVTPIGTDGRKSLDPANQSGRFALTPCRAHGGPVQAPHRGRR
jgi:hypothetical protein